MPGMKWTPEADTRLFLTILAVQGIKVDAVNVAAALGTTKASVEQRMIKLRQKAAAEVEEGGQPAPVIKRGPRGPKKGGKKAVATEEVETGGANEGDDVEMGNLTIKTEDGIAKTDDGEAMAEADNIKPKGKPKSKGSGQQKVLTGRVVKASSGTRKGKKADTDGVTKGVSPTMDGKDTEMNLTVEAPEGA
ncbi:MAG: hypothetical protein M1817_001755 [Caeruleum heppii]|nr:MAG: hypothetical protein M1817_001755 [Caeruleum heppii]